MIDFNDNDCEAWIFEQMDQQLNGDLDYEQCNN